MIPAPEMQGTGQTKIGASFVADGTHGRPTGHDRAVIEDRGFSSGRPLNLAQRIASHPDLGQERDQLVALKVGCSSAWVSVVRRRARVASWQRLCRAQRSFGREVDEVARLLVEGRDARPELSTGLRFAFWPREDE